MKAVRRAPRLGGVLEEGGDHVLALGEVRDRPEIDAVCLDALPVNDGMTAKPSTGSVMPAPISADTDRRERQERGAVDRGPEVGLGDGAELRRRRGGARARCLHGMRDEQVADPQEAEDERDDRADDQRGDADDEPDEDAGDADREADGPEAGRRTVRIRGGLFVGSLVGSVLRLSIQPFRPAACPTPNPPALPARPTAAIQHGSAVGGRGQPELGPPGVDALLHLGAHLDLGRPLRAPSSGPFAVASKPILPPNDGSTDAWSSWSIGPSARTTSRFGSTFAQTRKNTSS